MQKNTLHVMGTTSLVLSILALIVPWFLFMMHPFITPEGLIFFVVEVYRKIAFYALFVAAFITGVIARKSILGKTGLIISLICFVLAVCSWIYIFYMLSTMGSWS